MATTTTAMPADINAVEEFGRTKLYLAAQAGDAAEVARLLELKADFELLTFDKRKYLSLFNDKKTISLILFYLIQHSYTPLHIACEKGHAPVVRLLLKAGANKDTNDDDGFACFDLNEFMTAID